MSKFHDWYEPKSDKFKNKLTVLTCTAILLEGVTIGVYIIPSMISWFS